MSKQRGAQTLNPVVVDSSQEEERKNDTVTAGNFMLASTSFSWNLRTLL